MTIELKDIPGFSGYAITKDGRVWSKPRFGKGSKNSGGWLKPAVKDNQYLFVTLRKGKKSFAKYIHRLILETYMGPCPDGMEGRHLDGNRAKNELSNLEWGTPIQNQADRRRHGTYLCKDNAPIVKLTSGAVRDIRALYQTGLFSHVKLGIVFGIHPVTIGDVIRKETWT